MYTFNKNNYSSYCSVQCSTLPTIPIYLVVNVAESNKWLEAHPQLGSSIVCLNHAPAVLFMVSVIQINKTGT